MITRSKVRQLEKKYERMTTHRGGVFVRMIHNGNSALLDITGRVLSKQEIEEEDRELDQHGGTIIHITWYGDPIQNETENTTLQVQ